MTRTHNVDGVKVPYTTTEETIRDGEEQAAFDAKPMSEWRLAMDESPVSDDIELIIDSMDATQKEKLPQLVQDNHAAKKTLRSQKPV